MGDDNLLDVSSQDGVHHPKQTFAFEVEAGADVADDLVVRMRFLEGGSLSLEIVSLLRGADPAVDDPAPSGGGDGADAAGEVGLDVPPVVPDAPDGLEVAFLFPAPEGSDGDSELLRGMLGSE